MCLARADHDTMTASEASLNAPSQYDVHANMAGASLRFWQSYFNKIACVQVWQVRVGFRTEYSNSPLRGFL